MSRKTVIHSLLTLAFVRVAEMFGAQGHRARIGLLHDVAREGLTVAVAQMISSQIHRDNADRLSMDYCVEISDEVTIIADNLAAEFAQKIQETVKSKNFVHQAKG